MSSPASAPRPQTEPAAVLAWALLVFSSALYFGATNEADNDLWGHLFAGREILRLGLVPRVDAYSYTVAGLPWFNHEWLTHVVFGAVYDAAGSPGLLLGKLGLSLAMFGLTLSGILQTASWNTEPRPASPDPGDEAQRPTPDARRLPAWIWGSISVLTLAVLARGLAVRPQLFTYTGLALVLLLLDQATRGRRAWLWSLPPVFLLWANLHGGFVLGVAVLLLYSGWSALVPERRSLMPALIALVSIAATAINPFGPALLGYLWDELSRSHPISEWQPTQFGATEHAAFFLMLGAFLLTLPFMRAWRTWGWRPLLALAVGVFALRHQRHTAVFALCAAVPLTVQLRGAADWLGQRGVGLSASAQRLILGGVVALAVAQFAMTGARWWRDGFAITYNPREYPAAAVAALKAGGARGNLAVPLDWGAFVLWHLSPAIKPSIDGRFATVYPESVVEDNFAFFRGAPTWRRLLENYPTEAALVPADVSWPITREPGWQRVYADEVAALYVRGDRLGAFTAAAQAPASDGRFP